MGVSLLDLDGDYPPALPEPFLDAARTSVGVTAYANSCELSSVPLLKFYVAPSDHLSSSFQAHDGK